MMSREKTTSSPTLGRIYQHVARLTEGGGLLPQHAQHTALPDERAVAGARRRSEGRGGRRPARPLAGKEWKPETRKGAKNACVSYFRWLRVSGRADSDPSEFLPTVKRPEPHPRPCPDVVILAALSKATEGERLMLRLGAECGLRRFEIAKVHSRDVMRDLVGWSLAVVGKGDKQRIVPIGDDLALLIRSAHGYCFPGRWSGHVESSYIGRHLSDLLGDGWTAHSLRHRYATTTYAATHDLLLVSKLLGHASVETTQRYIAMPDERLRAAVAATRLAA